MSIRHQVLNLIKEKKILIDQKEYRFLIEQSGGRLDLPREDLTSSKTSFIYCVEGDTL